MLCCPSVVCTELMVKTCPDNDCLTNYLHLLDRCSCHQVDSLAFLSCWFCSNGTIDLVFRLSLVHRDATNSAVMRLHVVCPSVHNNQVP